MKFEDLKLGMTVFADYGNTFWIYYIDKWNVDETNPDTYYFPSLYIDFTEKKWRTYKDSIITKKTENELYHHLVSSCQPVNEMDSHDKKNCLKLLLDKNRD